MSIQYGRSRHSHHQQNSVNNKWSCIECTFLNGGSKIRCDMCLTPKPSQKNSIQSNANGHPKNPEPINKKKKSGSGGGIKLTTSVLDSPISPSTHKNGYNYSDSSNVNQGRKPNGSIIPANVSFNPKKSIENQTIFERWMIAQMERLSGQQPRICTDNNIMLTNLRRVRAPTTYETIQQQIDNNTNVMRHANNLDAGDWTDDEEEELSSAMYPNNSPRSQNSNNGFSPTPSDNEINEDQSYPKFGFPNNNGNGNGNGNGNKGSKHHLFISDSKEDATDYTFSIKQNLNKRRRKKSPRKKSKKKQTISTLWYKAQLELKQGKNPYILSKYNITLTNIRQHNPRFKDFQRRKSHHEKAATYLAVTGDKLHTNQRNYIANDDDDEYAFSDTDNGNDSQPNTPISNNSYNSYNSYNNRNMTPIFNPYDDNQRGNGYVE